MWDAIISKTWDTIYVGSHNFSSSMDITPYQYKLIRSKDFYDTINSVLAKKGNVTIVKEKLMNFVDKENVVEVETDQAVYHGGKVFNSVVLSDEYKIQQKYPLLNQHFIGWFIQTETPAFDDKKATFMDFELDQKGNTRFMYVLPISTTEALFEYTLFSEQLLDDKEYEGEIKKYLEIKGITDYIITEKEKGCIPMTSYEFRRQNSHNVLHIGTAGGWTKASTGFTFRNTEKKVKKLLKFLKNDNKLSSFDKRTRFWYYDVLLLDVLYKDNQLGATFFSTFFQKNKITKVLRFLDEETSFIEDLKIITKMPTGKFLKAVWARALR